VLSRVESVRADLRAAYPFEHAVEGITIGDSLVDKLPAKDDPGAVVACVSTMFDRYGTVTFRVLSQLADVAGRLEAAVGLPALPPAPESDPEEEAAAKKARRRAAAASWAAYGGRAVAGVVLMGLLLWWSLNPPTMAWGSGGEAYRPAAFTTSVETYSTYRPVEMPSFPEMFGNNERHSGRLQPGTPGGPGMPGMPGRDRAMNRGIGGFGGDAESGRMPGAGNPVTPRFGPRGADGARDSGVPAPEMPRFTPPARPEMPRYTPPARPQMPMPGRPAFPSGGRPGR
jgi:hypothetical protein